jgi:D-methionine transport system ATP-binding protein
VIRVENLRKVYRSGSGEFAALDGVSLEIADGSIFGIVGRSGAGKSTLIRCLNLLERPTSGRVWVDGEELTALPAAALRRRRQRIGMIFQHFHLLHARNVADNIAVPLEIVGMKRAERARRIAELLELVGLADKAHAFPSQLSGGQKQRVGIARALAAQPSCLLCDEATSALDSETTRQILALLRDVNERLGVTIVLITHELDVVKSICDSAALLEAGKVVEAGPLAALLGDRASRLGSALLPACAGLSHDHDAVAELTLLGGGVEAIGGQRVGRLRVGFKAPEGGLDFGDMLAFLNDRGVRAERV